MYLRRERIDAETPAGRLRRSSLVGPPEDPGPQDSRRESRRGDRQGVIWGAQLDTGDAMLDCVVLDVSPRGARLRFGAPVTVPESVTLVLRDGRRFEALRRWSRGTQVGVEFLRPGAELQLRSVSAQRARAVLEALRGTGSDTWLPMLQAERFFGDDAVRQAAEAAEAAQAHLAKALAPHAGVRT